MTNEERAVRRIYSQYKSRAKRKKIPFNLTLEEFTSLVIAKCRYCGCLESNKIKVKSFTFRYNGIDRMDSREGYSKGNVVTSCRFCNSIKGPMRWKVWTSFLNSVVVLNGGKPPFPLYADEEEHPSLSFYQFQ